MTTKAYEKPTNKPTDIRFRNRTGVQASPFEWRRAAEGAEAGTPQGQPDVSDLARTRVRLSQQAEPLGTMPAPLSFKGAASTAMEGLKGHDPAVFLDELGERLAFERTGVRLYDALLCKHAAAHLHEGAPTAEELTRIRSEELKHAALLTAAIERLGGDPTALTPCADAMAVASMGVPKLLSDPRTTFSQGLKAMLMVELADHDSWGLLADLADRLGHTDLGAAFRLALAEEGEHLRLVRMWNGLSIAGQAGVAPTPARVSPS